MDRTYSGYVSGRLVRLKHYYRDAATIVLVAAVSSILLSISERPSLTGLFRIVVIVLVLSAILHFASRLLWKAEDLVTKIAKHRYSMLLVAAAGLGVALSLSLLGRFPQPVSADEFSYLLAGDTFAHGRLTNPTHQMWVHFETFHVIQIPSYASKYPPAEGMILALGQLLGSPVIGVWISTGLLCGALFWMLKQWVPPKWAMVGAAMASLHPELLYWGHNFWGGQLAMAGGALVLGAFRRLLDAVKARDGLIAGIGLTLMANTRPYEGFVLTLGLGLVLFVWSKTETKSCSTESWVRFAAPACAVLLLTGVAMGYYNYRVTGSWLKLPYMVHQAEYDPVPLFLWQKMRTVPSYNHQEFYDLYVGIGKRTHDASRTLSGLLASCWTKMTYYADWYFLGFAAPFFLLIAIPLVLKANKVLQMVAVIFALFSIGILAETWANGSHYFAPAASLCFLLPLMAIRYWRVWHWKGLRIGLLLTRVLVMVTLLFFVNEFRLNFNDIRKKQTAWYYQRADLMQSMAQQGGRNLIIVRYLPGHSVTEDWVYNGADIDGSAVVWARDMGVEKNRELIDYFHDRRVWLLALGRTSGNFVPYTEAQEISEAQAVANMAHGPN